MIDSCRTIVLLSFLYWTMWTRSRRFAAMSSRSLVRRVRKLVGQLIFIHTSLLVYFSPSPRRSGLFCPALRGIGLCPMSSSDKGRSQLLTTYKNHKVRCTCVILFFYVNIVFSNDVSAILINRRLSKAWFRSSIMPACTMLKTTMHGTLSS